MLMPETEPHESCLLGQLNISLEICNYYQLSTGKLSTVTVLYHIISDIRRGKYCPAPLLFRRQAQGTPLVWTGDFWLKTNHNAN